MSQRSKNISYLQLNNNQMTSCHFEYSSPEMTKRGKNSESHNQKINYYYYNVKGLQVILIVTVLEEAGLGWCS